MRGKALTGQKADALWNDFLALCEKYGLTPQTVVKIANVRIKGAKNGSA